MISARRTYVPQIFAAAEPDRAVSAARCGWSVDRAADRFFLSVYVSLFGPYPVRYRRPPRR